MVPAHVDPLSLSHRKPDEELQIEKMLAGAQQFASSHIQVNALVAQTDPEVKLSDARLLIELAAAPVTSGDGDRVLAHIGTTIAACLPTETVLLLHSRHQDALSWTVFPTRPHDQAASQLIQNGLESHTLIDFHTALEWVKHTGQLTIYENISAQNATLPAWEDAVLIPLPHRSGDVLCIGTAAGQELTNRLLQQLVYAADIVAVMLHNLEEHRRALAGAIVTERIRLSREIHDGIAQNIGYINLKLSTLTEHLGPLGVQVRQRVIDIQQHTAQSLIDLRQEIAALRSGLSPEIEAAPRSLSMETIQSLMSTLHTMTSTHKLTLTTELYWPDTVSDTLVDPRLTTQLTRVVQEAVTNTIKHARATTVAITMSLTNGQMITRICDNGRGFDVTTALDAPDTVPDASQLAHFGLTMMKERTHSVGGTLHITSQKGYGTCVEVQIPLNPSHHAE